MVYPPATPIEGVAGELEALPQVLPAGGVSWFEYSRNSLDVEFRWWFSQKPVRLPVISPAQPRE
jgi:hypothetical protein